MSVRTLSGVVRVIQKHAADTTLHPAAQAAYCHVLGLMQAVDEADLDALQAMFQPKPMPGAYEDASASDGEGRR